MQLHRFKRIGLICCFCWPMLSFADGNLIVDPTKPDTYHSGAANQEYQLTSILVAKNRKLATINQQLLRVGEVINGAKLVAIYQDRVLLQTKTGDMTLPLIETQVRVPAK